MIKFEIANDVTIEVFEDGVCGKVAKALQSVNDCCIALNTLPYESTRHSYNEAYKAITELFDGSYYDNELEPFRNVLRKAYNKLNGYEHMAYKKYAEADFLEYASHKNEPTFNWDYYSDWHKDIYGFRPRS